MKYPDELHALHNDYPLAPEKLAIPYDMLSGYCKKIADEYKIKVDDVIKLIVIYVDPNIAILVTKLIMCFITKILSCICL